MPAAAIWPPVSLRHWIRRTVILGVLIGLGSVLVVAGWLSRTAASGVPLSPVFGERRIGATFPERQRVATEERPAGEMDDMTAYARPRTAGRNGFDPDRVDADVRAFYEQTDKWAMAYRVRWHPGFRLGARAAAPLTSRIEQLNLPRPGERRVRRLQSRFAGLESTADPREAVRAWVRTDPRTGEAVFVALYGSHQRGDERFVNIAAPLPGANLSTVLRLEHLPLADRQTTGVALATDEASPLDATDPGLYLNTPAGAFALPMHQRFRVWPADASGGPEPVDPRARLVATHEMRVAGQQFLTVTYAMWLDGEDGPDDRRSPR